MSVDHGLLASGTGASPSSVGTKYPRSSLAIGRSSHAAHKGAPANQALAVEPITQLIEADGRDSDGQPGARLVGCW